MTPSSPSQPASRTAIWAAMLSIYIVWGSTYLAMRIGVQTIPPFVMAGVRFVLAGGILLASQLLRGQPMPTLRQWRSAAIIGLFLLLGGNGMVVWAEQYVPSGITALLVGMTPLWLVILEAVFYRRRPSWLVLAGVLIGLLGMAVLIGPSQLTGLHGDVDPLGGAMVVLGALSWAGGSLYSRGAHLPDNAFLYNGMEMLSGGVALLLLATVTGEWSRLHIAAISLNSWLSFIYLVLFGSLIGFSSYTWLLRSGAPTMIVSTYAYVNPVVAVIIGNLLAQEALTPRVVLAALIIISGVVLITFTRKKKAAVVAPLEAPTAD